MHVFISKRDLGSEFYCEISHNYGVRTLLCFPNKTPGVLSLLAGKPPVEHLAEETWGALLRLGRGCRVGWDAMG